MFASDAELNGTAEEVMAVLHRLDDTADIMAASESVIASLLVTYTKDPLAAADFFHERLRKSITQALASLH